MKRLRWAALSVAGMIALLGGCGSKSGLSAFNPTPLVSNLFPPNITAGSENFTLFVKGSEFISGGKGASFAYWNGEARSSRLNAATGELLVLIPASDVVNPGVAQVTVFNPSPGGGTSPAISFNIEAQQAGAPAITSFAPPSATAGGANFTLTINGSNFAVNDVVTWNGSERTTTYLSANQVTAAITSQDILAAGFASVSVGTPALVVASPSLAYAVNGPNNPTPSIGSLSPASVPAGGSDLELAVLGSGFVASSVAEWNGIPLATAYVNGSRLMVLIPAARMAAAATPSITVTNPAPGGGISGGMTFTVQ